MKKRMLAAAVAMGVALPLAMATTAEAAPAPHPVIEKIQYNAPGYPDGGWNLNGEYIRVRNTGTLELNLQGWKIKDQAGNTYTFPVKWLHPGQYVNVRTGSGTATYYERYWGRSAHAWNNTGLERAYLVSKWGTIRDTCTYYGAAIGFKWC